MRKKIIYGSIVVAAFVAFFAVTVEAGPNFYISSEIAKIRKTISISTASVLAKLTIAPTSTVKGIVVKYGSGGTGNALETQDSSGNVKAALSYAGALDIESTFSSAGTAQVLRLEINDGTTDVDTAFIASDGEATFKSVNTDTKAADPCSGLNVGAIFYSAAGIICYCDQNGTDLKVDGSSAACSY